MAKTGFKKKFVDIAFLLVLRNSRFNEFENCVADYLFTF